MKKLLSMLSAGVLVLALALPVFASGFGLQGESQETPATTSGKKKSKKMKKEKKMKKAKKMKKEKKSDTDSNGGLL